MFTNSQAMFAGDVLNSFKPLPEFLDGIRMRALHTGRPFFLDNGLPELVHLRQLIGLGLIQRATLPGIHPGFIQIFPNHFQPG
jgi:hypothetical protein